MKNSISIITATYNSQATIADTLESIHSQKYTNFSHIIIDGLSTDNTIKIINSFDTNKLSLSIGPDNGIYDAMNKGLKSSTGDIIGFLNSDDMYADENTLCKIAAVFENPSIEACYGDLVYVNQDNSKILRYWKSGTYKHYKFSQGWCPPHPTFYIRRSLLERCELFDLNYKLAADAEYMMRILDKSNVEVSYIEDVLVRMRTGGATSKNISNVLKQNIEIFRALKKNNIKFSYLNFLFQKLHSRLIQVLIRDEISG
jgi:glycosyltransferase involved in cell wall biosynthesis